jgi:hypothetical protein
MSDEAERVEVGFDRSQREVLINCGEAAFKRYLEALAREGAFTGAEIDLERCRTLTIWKGFPPPISKARANLLDQLALAGCATICVALVLVFAIGVGTIAGWF